MVLLNILLFILCPVLGITMTMLLYIFDSRKKGIVYSLILGFLFGIIAYYFTPLPTYDLTRDHIIIRSIIRNLNIDYLINLYNSSEIEINRLVISYIVALTRNVDLLQFLIVFSGYSIIYYMLYDYRKMKKINNLTFTIITLFITFGFYTKYFFSGLFNLYSIILFAFAFYLSEVRKKKKKVYIPIYVVSILFHNSMFFPLLFLLLYKYFKKKVTFQSVIIALMIAILPWFIFGLLSNIDIKVIKDVSNMYFSYVSKNSDKLYAYDGFIFLLEISKFIFVLFTIIFNKNIRNENVRNYIILLSIGLIPMMFQSIVMIRFVNLITFIGIIPIFDYFSSNNINKKNNKKIMFILLLLLTILYCIFFFYTITSLNYGNLINEKLFSNLFSIFNK